MTTPPQSPLNPRDFVELLDELIAKRLNGYPLEECELIRHQLTDYLTRVEKGKGE